jgi:hypothetical protein
MYTLIKIAREEQEIKLENNSIGTRLTYLQVLTRSVFLFVCLLGQIRKRLSIYIWQWTEGRKRSDWTTVTWNLDVQSSIGDEVVDLCTLAINNRCLARQFWGSPTGSTQHIQRSWINFLMCLSRQHMELNLPDCCDLIGNCIETDGSCCHPGPSLLGSPYTSPVYFVRLSKFVKLLVDYPLRLMPPRWQINKIYEEVLRWAKCRRDIFSRGTSNLPHAHLSRHNANSSR